MKILLISLGLFSVFATLIKLIKNDAWWIRMFDFPQAQYTFLGIISLAGLLINGYWDDWYVIVLVILLAGSLIYQSTIIIPYTMLYPVQTQDASLSELKEDSQIALMVVNVYQYNEEYEKCVGVVEKADADIVLAVETSKKWQEHFSEVLDKKYPHQCLRPLDNTYGMLLYSKLELSDTEIRNQIEENIPSIKTKIKLRNGTHVNLFCVHPEPPSPTESDTSTERDAELYLTGEEVRDMEGPVIVAGDLNDVAWSKSTTRFQRLSGLLDPRIGRGFYNTFHAKYPYLRWPLDHVFHSTHFKLISLKRCDKTGSDHFPIYIKLSYHHQNDDEQEELQPDQQDKEESKEKIEEAKEMNS